MQPLRNMGVCLITNNEQGLGEKVKNREIAEFILSMVDMSVLSELPEEEHLQFIETDLEAIRDTSLYYYLECACDSASH